MERRPDQAEVLETLYAGVLDEVTWARAMTALAAHLDGTGTFYLRSDPTSFRVLQSECVAFDPAVNVEYLTDFADKEVRLPSAKAAGVGQIVTEQHLLDLREFRRSVIYNDLLLRYDIPYVMAVCTERSPAASATFVVERSVRQGPFERAEIDRFDRVMPHLLRALQLRGTLAALRADAAASSAWLEHLGQTVIRLDHSGRVRTSAVPIDADRLRACGLACWNGRLRALSADDDRRLQVALAAAGMASSEPPRSSSLHMRAARQPTLLHAIPLGFDSEQLPPGILVIIAGAPSTDAPPTGVIQRLLAVTPAEARIARELYLGGSVPECARRLNISIHTGRTHVKAIFRKTGCRNQAELVRRIAWLHAGGARVD
jgi:DNA-binding CsgD family transcriptional regulator